MSKYLPGNRKTNIVNPEDEFIRFTDTTGLAPSIVATVSGSRVSGVSSFSQGIFKLSFETKQPTLIQAIVTTTVSGIQPTVAFMSANNSNSTTDPHLLISTSISGARTGSHIPSHECIFDVDLLFRNSGVTGG